MDVFIDSDVFATEQTSLSGILTEVMDHLRSSGRLIVEIRLDGEPLNEREQQNIDAQKLASGEVQLITADPVELGLATLDEVKEALTGAREAQTLAAEALRADETGKALEHVRSSLMVWQQAQQTVTQIAELLAVPLGDLQVDQHPATQVIDNLAASLTQARDELLNGDWLGLADTLGYDLDEAAVQWTTMLGMLADWIREVRGRKS
ncbi:hypothetical protein HED60_22835 [Planctomycetales bacterium ZRK34]|nr:hypothetical protein HED60_22835 [Planctomycetales bacterium ZRK34]